MLEKIGNPLGIFFVRLLASNGFDIFRVSQCDVTGMFENIEDRNPVLPGRFHTNILAVILTKPL
ncbi:hypothetical protein D3C78_1934060 [compost metagenome]